MFLGSCCLLDLLNAAGDMNLFGKLNLNNGNISEAANKFVIFSPFISGFFCVCQKILQNSLWIFKKIFGKISSFQD
jgi:hypothetical protein